MQIIHISDVHNRLCYDLFGPNERTRDYEKGYDALFESRCRRMLERLVSYKTELSGISLEENKLKDEIVAIISMKGIDAVMAFVESDKKCSQILVNSNFNDNDLFYFLWEFWNQIPPKRQDGLWQETRREVYARKSSMGRNWGVTGECYVIEGGLL